MWDQSKWHALALTTGSGRYHQNLVSLLQSCTGVLELQQVHSHMIKTGRDLAPFPISKLLAASILVDFPYATSLFQRIPNPNLFMFNTMLRGHSSISQTPGMGDVSSLFNSIRARGFPLDQFSFISALKSCARNLARRPGTQIHGTILRSGHGPFVNVRNTLISFYSACGMVGDAQRLFDEITQKTDAVSWSALMGCYLQASNPTKVVELFREMRRIGGFEFTQPSVFVNILSASKDLTQHCVGESLHGYCTKVGVCEDLNVASSIVTMYGNYGFIDSARKVFDGISSRDVVLWNCMVDGYVRSGILEESLALLQRMTVEGIKPNAATLVGLLSACASSGALLVGQLVDEFVKEEMLELDAILGTALVNMYSKCGFIEKAIEIFDMIENKDVKSWTSMITGLGAHGKALEALQLFQKMEEIGTMPNEVTFLAVLSACSHGGLVTAGKDCFNKMVQEYGLSPRVDHYGCMIDLLARAGLLKEAHELIKSLPIERDAMAWRALLAACRIHGNIELGKLAQQSLMALGEEHPTDSILLLNTYSIAGRLVDVMEISDTEGGKKPKEIGCSSIEMNGYESEAY